MSECKCVCIVCRKDMKNFLSDGLQPENGLSFMTKGHYGSIVFDPMDGSYLEICVCDSCLVMAAADGSVYRAEMLQLSKYKTTSWNGDTPTAWETIESDAKASEVSDDR